jgi:hypothetical protein
VDWFFKLTAAPAITEPEGSVTIPVSPPVITLCANTRVGNKSSKAINETASRRYFSNRNRIFQLQSSVKFSETANRWVNLTRQRVQHLHLRSLGQISCLLRVGYKNAEG